MEEPKIEELWAKCRSTVEHIFKDFKYIEIDFTFKRGGETPGGTPGDPQDIQIEEVKDWEKQMGLRKSGTMMYAKLLTEQDINKIKDKFYDDINNALEEAKRKHVSIGRGG
jgi:hypothetical protein